MASTENLLYCRAELRSGAARQSLGATMRRMRVLH
jgi:hypothetical protein